MSSVSDMVRVYLKNRPYALEALSSGIVNYSSLARALKSELNVSSVYAVKAAIVRYAEQLSNDKYTIEDKALSVLKDNRLTLLNCMNVVITDREVGLNGDVVAKIGSLYIYLTDTEVRQITIKKIKNSIIKLHENCSVILVSSTQKLEDVPGVVAFLTSVFAEQRINVIELISCYTETILVVKKDDALRSYELLSEMTK
jgi:fucose 4-O-acetylase-like acetyltransferase